MVERILREAIKRKLPSALTVRRHSLAGPGDRPEVEARLEDAAGSFVRGLKAAVSCRGVSELHAYLSGRLQFNNWQRGFAFEGAAMGIGILKSMLPWRRRMVEEFAAGWGRNYIHLIHVGIGWARAWARAVPDQFPEELDPLLRWLTVDGYGFYCGLLRWDDDAIASSVEQFAPYTGRILCQGYGRALWFLARGSPAVIDRVIIRLPRQWQPDAWSGVGLACVYAGCIDNGELQQLVTAAGEWKPALAQGAAFAAKARKLAGDLEPSRLHAKERCECEYYHEACGVICGMDARAAAAITDDALDGLPSDGDEPAYGIWQRRIRGVFSSLNANGVCDECKGAEGRFGRMP